LRMISSVSSRSLDGDHLTHRMMPSPVDTMGVHQNLSSNSLNSGNCGGRQATGRVLRRK